jgi:ribonuclease E
MLINAQHPEELRIAIVDDTTLESFQVEVAEQGLTRGNIYRGVIANVQPSLNAAFIDYGSERSGFLPVQDVVPDAWYRQPPKGHGGRPRIEDVLDRGKPIVVQVLKEAEGGKGAAVTTNLSLAGRYLVLTPFDDTRGVSRKVEDEETRRRLKQLAAGLEVPQGAGVIVRTNALDQNKTALGRDLAALLRLWKQITAEARKGKGVRLLYSDQDLVLQALRDYLDSSIAELLVDDDEAHANAEAYMRAFMPRGKTRLVRYSERVPLFSKYGLESQIDRIYERRVELPSGGSIVIDRTEALTAVDVNSGRSTRAASQEETALNTNLEAAREVARQLRLRDIGGLFVVDFIDMRASKSRRRVEKELRDAMKADKARSSVGRISDNGLLELNRQRIQQALSMRTHRACPTCDGTGRIASPELVGLNLLRRIEGRAAAASLMRVRVELHPELADAFQNGRRAEIAAIEREFDLRVEVIASAHLHRPDQKIEWFEREPGDEPAVRPLQRASVHAAQLAESAPAAAGRDDEEDEGDAEREPETTGKRSRKRRRSRRKRGGGGAGETAAAAEQSGRQEGGQTGDGEPQATAPAPGGGPDDDDREAEKATGTGYGGRAGHGEHVSGVADGGQDGDELGGETEDGQESGQEDGPQDGQEGGQEGGQSQGRRRSRRRGGRRRSRRKPAGDAPAE